MSRPLSARPGLSSLALFGLIAVLGGGVAAVAAAGNPTCTYSVGMSRSDHGAGTYRTLTVTDTPNATFRFDGCSPSGKNGQMCVSKYGISAGCAPEATSALNLNPHMYYRLTTAWQGDCKSLDVVNDGTNNKLQLATGGAYSGQMWKLTPTGYTY